MTEPARAQVLAIMGSGETSPTMVTIHKELVAKLGSGNGGGLRGELLDTPYAFQENAAEISARAQSYFARSVGLDVDVIDAIATGSLARIRAADWVFAGPGSPSYALARWRDGQVAEALRDRIAAGTGITIIASAAAAAMGFVALPVYEIYKVGADPYWLEGLDLLSVLDLRVAVIPHYDNAEGGTHDTRFCYLGERRLKLLEGELPADAAVLGVDEHTALIFDLETGRADVVGRGGATVRKAGRSTVLPAGSVITLPDLGVLVRSGIPARSSGVAGPENIAGAAHSQAELRRSDGPATLGGRHDMRELPEITRDCQQRFEVAARERNGSQVVSAILDLESAIEAWSTDTDENDNADRARAVLRGLIVRLGKAAEDGLTDPGDRLRPAVEPLIMLREELRSDGSYEAADVIRDALTAVGVQVQDSPGGTRWAVRR